MPVNSVSYSRRTVVFLAALTVSTACSKDANGSATAAAAQTDTTQPGGAGRKGVAGGPAAGVAGRVRSSPSLTLAATAVAPTAPATIEDAGGLTSDPRPVATVHSRPQ